MKWTLWVFGAILTFFSAVTLGGSVASPGTLSMIVVWSGGQFIVTTSGTRTAIPTCAANQPARFALDSTTAAGKTQAAVLMTAYSTSRQVTLVGTGACDVVADTETVNYFYTDD